MRHILKSMREACEAHQAAVTLHKAHAEHFHSHMQKCLKELAAASGNEAVTTGHCGAMSKALQAHAGCHEVHKAMHSATHASLAKSLENLSNYHEADAVEAPKATENVIPSADEMNSELPNRSDLGVNHQSTAADDTRLQRGVSSFEMQKLLKAQAASNNRLVRKSTRVNRNQSTDWVKLMKR